MTKFELKFEKIIIKKRAKKSLLADNNFKITLIVVVCEYNHGHEMRPNVHSRPGPDRKHYADTAHIYGTGSETTTEFDSL